MNDEQRRGERRRLMAVLAVGALLLVIAAAAVDLVVLAGSNSRPPAGAPIPGSTVTAAAPPPPAQNAALPAPTGPEEFGVSVNWLYNDVSYTPAQVNAQLAAIHATGATLARTDALWEAAEPLAPSNGQHHYNWAFDDAIARSLAQHGLTWLPIIDYTAPWNQSIPGQDHSPPLSDADYADYAAAFAARYGPGGTFWRTTDVTSRPVTTIEIWNEPDSPEFWLPSPRPGAYGDLYLTARAAIQKVDPSIRVIVGGLIDPARFLKAMVDSRPLVRGHVDGVAIHPYGRPGVVISKVRAARAALVSLGMGSVPLYVTEFGWTTSPSSAASYAPVATRAGYIRQTLDDLGHLSCGLAASILYTWVTPETDPGNAQDWYGIAKPMGGGTPATAAFAAGLSAAAGPAGASAPAPCPS